MLKNWYSSNFSLSHSLRSFLHHFGINKTPTILSMFCGYNVSERERRILFFLRSGEFSTLHLDSSLSSQSSQVNTGKKYISSLVVALAHSLAAWPLFYIFGRKTQQAEWRESASVGRSAVHCVGWGVLGALASGRGEIDIGMLYAAACAMCAVRMEKNKIEQSERESTTHSRRNDI